MVAGVGVPDGIAVGTEVAVAGSAVAVGGTAVEGATVAGGTGGWVGCAVSVACTAFLTASTSGVGLEQPMTPTAMTNTITRSIDLRTILHLIITGEPYGVATNDKGVAIIVETDGMGVGENTSVTVGLAVGVHESAALVAFDLEGGMVACALPDRAGIVDGVGAFGVGELQPTMRKAVTAPRIARNAKRARNIGASLH